MSIQVKVLGDKQWRQLVEVLSRQALFVAKLLAGEMPTDIEEVFKKARLSLFPEIWAVGEVPDTLYGGVQQPPVSAGWVRRLGKFPFWRGEGPLAEAVEPVYVEAAAVGLRTFLGEGKGAANGR